MSPSFPAEPFVFETSYDTAVVRPEYAAHQRSSLGVTEGQLFAVFAAIGIVSLFWRYTIALGVSMLAMTAVLWLMRQRSLRARKRYGRLEEPPTKIRIRVTERGYSIQGDDFAAETSWNRVINGFECDGYLLVQAWRMPRLYLPLDEMRAAGVYDQIKAIVDAKSAERKALVAEASAAS